MDQRAAHTAEHAFIGSLQKLLGHTLQVRKVQHSAETGIGTAHIVIPNLDLDSVVRAEKMTNSLILEGRKVTTRSFGSIEEAKAAVNGLRANEQRISGPVRVVLIEGHDAAACSMDHVEDLSKCDFFLVSRISKSGNEYEVDFVIGKEAREAAIDISARFHKTCMELGANPNTIESTARKLRSDFAANESRLGALSSSVLHRIPMRSLGKSGAGNVEVYTAALSDLSDDKIVEFAGEKIKPKSGAIVLVCIANVVGDSARVVLAVSESAGERADLNLMFKKHSKGTGKGGGRPYFVTGIVPKEISQAFVDGISAEFV